MVVEVQRMMVAGAVLAGLALAVGCAKKQTREGPDICANGACDDVPDCELGDCLELSTVTTEHSPNAGTFAEGETASCPFPPSDVPELETLLDDTKIPQFNRGRQRRTNYAKGHGFLQDHELHENLLGVQGALFDCLDLAQCYQEQEIAGGELDFEFELEPNGRVSAVSVSPSEGLDQPLVRACARKSVYEYKFPSWSGGRMVVSYRVEIDEG